MAERRARRRIYRRKSVDRDGCSGHKSILYENIPYRRSGREPRHVGLPFRGNWKSGGVYPESLFVFDADHA
jgi:hypothetical protein